VIDIETFTDQTLEYCPKKTLGQQLYFWKFVKKHPFLLF